jgi:N-acetylglucosamine-6-sulfatase
VSPLGRAGKHPARTALAMTAALTLVLVAPGRMATGQLARDGQAATTPTHPNIVLFLTDDQRWDELTHMPKLQADLVAHGVSFAPNGIISDPLCCPSRATILTGTYSHTNKIYGNNGQYGGFTQFRARGDEANTIATVLNAQGYRTGLIGKYLNQYIKKDVAYIPPGWDYWFATMEQKEGDPYYNWLVSDNGSLATYSSDPASYSTTVLDQKALAFIQSTPADQPLFLDLATHAPHAPFTPAPQYLGSLAGQVPDLTAQPNFNEADVSDKSAYIQALPLLTAKQIKGIKTQYEHQFETLLSVDDMIGDVVNELQADGRLSNTLFVFLSDQGLELGSHRLSGKLVPYEESIRTPFMIRWDALGVAPRTDPSVVSNVDLASTFAAAAGTIMPGSEGLNLLPLLQNPGMPWRPDVLIEHLGSVANPSYCGVRSAAYMYAQYKTGEEELYDLTADSDEVNNVAANPAYASVLESMRSEAHVLCQPPPPGFHFTH